MTVLKDGTTDDIVGYNIKLLIKAGHSQKQAEVTAIAHAHKQQKSKPVLPDMAPKGFE